MSTTATTTTKMTYQLSNTTSHEHEPLTKKQPRKTLRYRKPLISTAILVVAIIILTCSRFFNFTGSKSSLTTSLSSLSPFQSTTNTPLYNIIGATTPPTTTNNNDNGTYISTQQSSMSLLQDDKDDQDDKDGGADDVEVECDQVYDFDGDKCEFVKDNCEPEGMFNYMEFAYCTIKVDRFINKAVIMIIFAVALALFLVLLSSTADGWLVPSLTVVSHELKLSPAVAGATLLSLANGAPDVLTSLAAVKQGAEKGQIGLVLGSLSGATMCICALILGLSLMAAKDKTLLSKSSFLRNMSGLVFCVLPTIGLCMKGTLTWIDATILIVLYLCYLTGSVILLQKQQARKVKVANEERKQAFLRSTTSYRLLFPEDAKKDATSHTGGLAEGLLSGQYDDSLPQETGTTFLSSPHGNTLKGLTIDPNDIDESNNSKYALHDISSPGGTIKLSVNRLDDDPEGLDSPNETNGENGDDEDDDVDQTYFMEGLFFDPKWKKMDEKNAKRQLNFFQRNISRILWVIFWPFALIRWLSIPSTDHRPDYLRGPKKAFLFISPFFATLVILLFLLGPEFDGKNRKLWILGAICGLALAIGLGLFYFLFVLPSVSRYNKQRAEIELYVDSTRDQTGLSEEELNKVSELVLKYHLDGGANNENNEQAKPFLMTLFMIFISAISFIASVAWLGIFAQEIVEILQTLGIMFHISASFLGLSVLAISNSLPDGASDITLAKKGQMAIAYSAIWSAPVLSNTFGLGLSIFYAYFDGVKEIKYKITSQVWLCWASVVACIVVTIIGFLVIYNRQPPSKFGYVLCILYAAFIVAAIVLEIIH